MAASAELLATRDTGTVLIRLAVDPSGQADLASVEVLASPHPAFTRAVLEVLPQYRFVPAETGGGPPAQLVLSYERHSHSTHLSKHHVPSKGVSVP